MEAFFDAFLNFDLSVFQWVQSIQTPILTTIMKIVTTLGDEGIIFILMGIIFLFTKKFRKVGFTILAALVVMLICNNLVFKELCERIRPFYIFNPDAVPKDHIYFEEVFAKATQSLERLPELAEKWKSTYVYPDFVHAPSSWSFPSGHTSSAFTAAFAVLFYNRKIGIPMTFFAALMGFTRIYVQVHYCSDVIAAALVSIAYAAIAVLVIKLLYPKVEPIIDKVFAKLTKKKA